MKQFSCLDEAFHHQNDCPFCHKAITRGYTQISFNGGETLVEFDVGKASMTFDYKSGILKEYKKSSPYDMVTTRSYPVYSCNGSARAASVSGKELFRVICVCNECQKYTYVLQVHVDLDLNRVVGIFLNSETFCFNRKDYLHEIKNIYATGKTVYNKFSYSDENADHKAITLPLIPVDLHNPEKTLERIKTLIIFS